MTGTTAILLDGYGFKHGTKLCYIAQNLGTAPRTVIEMDYDNTQGNNLPNLRAAVIKLDALLHATAGAKVVCAISMGCQLAYKWLREYGPTSTIPAADLSFVLLANPENQYTGSVVLTTTYGAGYDGIGVPSGTPYSVINVIRQFDGVADYPNLPSNVNYAAAVLNAQLGMVILHDSIDVSRSDYIHMHLDDTYYGKTDGNVECRWYRTYPIPGQTYSRWMKYWTRYQDRIQRAKFETAYNRPVTIPVPDYNTIEAV